MTDDFIIEVWSDVVCPFCYLGNRQLDRALEGFEHRDRVTLHHRAFELDPRAKLSFDKPLEELVAAKYAAPVSRIRTMHERLEGEAAALGMTWSLASARPTNTFDAHRLIAFASSQGLGAELSERLFRAYFCDGELVSDRAFLTGVATDLGVRGAHELWADDAFGDVVRADEAYAQELGITGVPSLLVDSKFMVVGAQGTERILDVLRRAWARRAA